MVIAGFSILSSSQVRIAARSTPKISNTPLAQWYHVALVFDGRTMTHYVDGKAEMSGPLTITPLAQGKTSLGVRLNRVFWFKGAISRVRFTNRALTPKEFMTK